MNIVRLFLFIYLFMNKYTRTEDMWILVYAVENTELFVEHCAMLCWFIFLDPLFPLFNKIRDKISTSK